MEETSQDQDGSEPWVCTVRKGLEHHGPHAWPLPGVGSVVQALTKGCFLLVFEEEPILAQGFTLNGAFSYFETVQGQQHLKTDSVKIVHVVPNQMIWIPFVGSQCLSVGRLTKIRVRR